MATGGDRLESVTQEAMVNGANAALVLKANGEPEIIQFRDVTLNPDGSATLSGLLRGRRGTDVFVDGHQAREVFVLLDPDDVETMVTALGDLDLPRYWRAVGFGTIFEDAETVVTNHTGRDLKPYAPWNVQALLSGNPTDISKRQDNCICTVLIFSAKLPLFVIMRDGGNGAKWIDGEAAIVAQSY